MPNLPSQCAPAKPSHSIPDTNGTPRLAANVLCAVWINAVAYEVSRLPPEPGTGVTKVYRLKNAANENVYHIGLTVPHGPVCECGDFIFRRDGQDPAGCKHIQALRQLGMLPMAPKPLAFRSAADFARNEPADYDAMLGGRPPEPALTEAEMLQLANLVEIDLGDDATPF